MTNTNDEKDNRSDFVRRMQEDGEYEDLRREQREMDHQAKCRHQDWLDESGVTARERR